MPAICHDAELTRNSRMLKRLSIRHKQLVIIMATSTAALLLACAGFVSYEVFSFREAMTSNLSSVASLIGNNCTAALHFDDRAAATQVLNTLKGEHHIIAACIYDKNGRIYASYTQDQKPFPFPKPALTDSHEFGPKYFDLFRRIDHGGERLGTSYVCASSDQLSIRVEQYVGIIALVLCPSLIVALFLSLRLQRFVSEPILQLASMAKVVSVDKNYALRAPPQGQDEIGQLIDGFNEMLEQIQARDAALQAAHDQLEKRVLGRTQELQQEIVERTRAELSLTQQLTRINLLNSITRAIIDRHDLENVVVVVLRELEEHLPIDFGRVYLFDSQSQMISVAARRYQGKSQYAKIDLFAGLTPLKDTGLDACSTGEIVSFPETSSSQTAVAMKLHQAGLHSALAVPLRVENELFGILLAARVAPKAFNSEESEFLRMLSEQVALAAHQARLHTQLQHAYDELRQTQVAVMQQERLRALGQMASGIAHDINNALCPVVVYSDLLLQDTSQFSDVTVRNLENIKTAGEDIAHIVCRMREFYRQRDKSDSLVAVQLNKTATQVLELTRPRWRDIPQARGVVIELETDLEPGLPEITGNGSELREALTNLILNSVDAMPEGGKLTIRTRAGGWDRSPGAATHVFIEVSDTGSGMDEQTRRRCLEPFFSTKGKRGTGLGLAMVYGIAERHEGSIDIESAPGRGTTMRLIFPVKTGRDRLPAGGGKPATRVPALRVLCIDDEPLLREMLRQILENGGHTVEVADGGSAGLEVFRSAVRSDNPFDVVITDLGMPYVDGRQLAQALKAESPRTPIIMLTGWGSMMKEDGDVPIQVDGVLSKPPKIAELYEMLGAVTSKAKAA